MYNIDLYTYWKKPFTRTKKFTIHPLDEPGKEKYLSTESHCTHYLKRTDPFVFKSILGVDYNTLIQQQKEDIQTLKDIKSSKTINELSKSQNPIEKGMHKTNYVLTEPKEKNITEDKKSENNRYNTCGNENDFNSYQRQFKTFHSQKNFRPYHKNRTFKENYGYENISKLKSKAEKYAYMIDNMKLSEADKGNLNYKRKYDGFTHYEIPLIPLNNKNDYANERFKNTLKYLKSTEKSRNPMNEEELKQNLFNQTSKEFLKRHHLPDVLKIANSTQLIRKQKIGLSKEMGERYNPYSLIAPSKNRTGRNYVGDLFKH
jgi:hypothetical protein